MDGLSAMAESLPDETALLDLPLEVLTGVCQHLDLHDLVRVAETCKRFRHGGMETEELPTESPVVTVLRTLAFPCLEVTPDTHPMADSWVAYLARCARQRCCREAPPIAAGWEPSLFVDAAGRLLSCGRGAAAGHGDEEASYPFPTPVAAMAGVRIRSVTAGLNHSLALRWDGVMYSWGDNNRGHLGHGDRLARPSPVLVEGLAGLRGIAADCRRSFAVTQSGAVFHWGQSILPGSEDSLWPTIVEEFEGVRVCRVCTGADTAFAIGEDGEVVSWGVGDHWILGHGDRQHQPLPKRAEALRGVRVSSVAVGVVHALALAEDGQVYAWVFE
jgi:hypothetical protein